VWGRKGFDLSKAVVRRKVFARRPQERELTVEEMREGRKASHEKTFKGKGREIRNTSWKTGGLTKTLQK